MKPAFSITSNGCVCGAPDQFETGRPTANTLMGGGGVVNDFA